MLSSQCNGYTKAIVTQENTPVGAELMYDGEKRKPLQVTSAIFNTFAKVSFFVCICCFFILTDSIHLNTVGFYYKQCVLIE